jgi:hypothetical protein
LIAGDQAVAGSAVIATRSASPIDQPRFGRDLCERLAQYVEVVGGGIRAGVGRCHGVDLSPSASSP